MKSNRNSQRQKNPLRRYLISNNDQNDNNGKQNKIRKVPRNQVNRGVESEGERISISRTRSYKEAIDIREDIELDSFLSPHFCLNPSMAKTESRSGSDTSLNSARIKTKKRVDFV